MADGKRRYKSDRKDYKISVKLTEKDMDILKVALKRTGMTASAYIRELIRTGGNIDTSYPEDRARVIRVIAGIANNINQAVKLGNSQGRLYYSDIDKLQSSMDEVKKTFGEALEVWRLQARMDEDITDVTGKSEFMESEEKVSVDKVGWIVRRILELGGYENISDSVKADIFGFDIADVSGSIWLFSDVMKRLGIKLDGDEMYEEFQRIYDESVGRDAGKDKAEDKMWNRGRGR